MVPVELQVLAVVVRVLLRLPVRPVVVHLALAVQPRVRLGQELLRAPQVLLVRLALLQRLVQMRILIRMTKTILTMISTTYSCKNVINIV